MFKFIILVLFSFSATAAPLFHLPKNYKATKQKLMKEKKDSPTLIKDYQEFCSITKMTNAQYIEMLAYSELTSMSCGEVILEAVPHQEEEIELDAADSV